jgi:hypothetical protein
LFSLGLLALAYAREPLLLLAAWEVVGLALWLFLHEIVGQVNVLRYALCIHLPGILLLAAILFVSVPPFAPPQGGEAAAWPLLVTLSFGLVSLFRAFCWLFLEKPATSHRTVPLIALYILISPFPLAKALVAAPWDDFGVWLLALTGTGALFGSVLAMLFSVGRTVGVVSAIAALGVVGFGLAPLSPLAATGAVALLLVVALWTAYALPTYRGAFLLLACLPGVWLLTEGALDARYRLVAAILLPALLFLAYYVRRDSQAVQLRGPARLLSGLAAFLLVLVAIYPQAAVEWVLRPAVGAMAGGVGVPSTLVADWALGLLVRSPQEIVLASMPATGIALAVFLAWVALYWLRGLARLVTSDGRPPATDDGNVIPSTISSGEAE